MYTKIEGCRICGNTDLVEVLDLGEQMLTGVFPRAIGAAVTTGPLRLVKCHGGNDVCGLLQLQHSYESQEVYGENYGYRSGLNASMVAHLHGKVAKILAKVELSKGDLVVDIGSNDGTTLRAYPEVGAILLGIDPTGSKFKEFYPAHVHLIPDFFSARRVSDFLPRKKAKIITSFAMFYDLEDPIAFMREVRDVLADDGVWVFEQSYMPRMLEVTAYDTVCHEHLEYYALRQIKWMADRVGFEILDVEFNDTNGGSFSVTMSKSGHGSKANPKVLVILADEKEKKLHELSPYREFAARVASSRTGLLDFVRSARREGKTVAALGASTKGNVILQYCGFTQDEISFIGEVNQDKFGCCTPGTWIPIIPESVALIRKPDYLLVLPWHFSKFFEQNEKFDSLNLVFPLPELRIRPSL
jgi:NDP-4-keto-2,6-dideoxyhexose 3-C-methyltransferase